MNGYGMSGFGMGFGWLIPILFIVVLFYFINGSKKEGISARDILDKRYAKGEIDEEEYKKKKDELER
jgi:putative membrane protein